MVNVCETFGRQEADQLKRVWVMGQGAVTDGRGLWAEGWGWWTIEVGHWGETQNQKDAARPSVTAGKGNPLPAGAQQPAEGR